MSPMRAERTNDKQASTRLVCLHTGLLHQFQHFYSLSHLLNTIFPFYSVPSLPGIGHPPNHPVSQTQLVSDRAVALVLVRHQLKKLDVDLNFLKLYLWKIVGANL